MFIVNDEYDFENLLDYIQSGNFENMDNTSIFSGIIHISFFMTVNQSFNFYKKSDMTDQRSNKRKRGIFYKVRFFE